MSSAFRSKASFENESEIAQLRLRRLRARIEKLLCNPPSDPVDVAGFKSEVQLHLGLIVDEFSKRKEVLNLTLAGMEFLRSVENFIEAVPDRLERLHDKGKEGKEELAVRKAVVRLETIARVLCSGASAWGTKGKTGNRGTKNGANSKQKNSKQRNGKQNVNGKHGNNTRQQHGRQDKRMLPEIVPGKMHAVSSPIDKPSSRRTPTKNKEKSNIHHHHPHNTLSPQSANARKAKAHTGGGPPHDGSMSDVLGNIREHNDGVGGEEEENVNNNMSIDDEQGNDAASHHGGASGDEVDNHSQQHMKNKNSNNSKKFINSNDELEGGMDDGDHGDAGGNGDDEVGSEYNEHHHHDDIDGGHSHSHSQHHRHQLQQRQQQRHSRNHISGEGVHSHPHSRSPKHHNNHVHVNNNNNNNNNNNSHEPGADHGSKSGKTFSFLDLQLAWTRLESLGATLERRSREDSVQELMEMVGEVCDRVIRLVLSTFDVRIERVKKAIASPHDGMRAREMIVALSEAETGARWVLRRAGASAQLADIQEKIAGLRAREEQQQLRLNMSTSVAAARSSLKRAKATLKQPTEQGIALLPELKQQLNVVVRAKRELLAGAAKIRRFGTVSEVLNDLSKTENDLLRHISRAERRKREIAARRVKQKKNLPRRLESIPNQPSRNNNNSNNYNSDDDYEDYDDYDDYSSY